MPKLYSFAQQSRKLEPMVDVQTVVGSFSDYLLLKNKRAWKAYQQRRQDDSEAAMAEAIVFRVLQRCGARPEPNHMPDGGPDFVCANDRLERFKVDATSFKRSK
jgi:hypothetical protein